MSEPKLISPMLDNFAMGDPISDHNGVRSCPAMDDITGKKYIVKIISSPASATQLNALLLTGAYTDKAQALSYYEDVAKGIVNEVKILSKLADLEGFMAFDNHQFVPMDDGNGYDVYLLGTYKMSLAKFFKRETMTHLQALNLGLDLCAALATCRRAGYLYVNLKPENIYLTTDNGFRIGDLGFLKLDSLKFATLPDRYRSSYTAPEVDDAFAELNTSLDVYATGLILYQAFNGGQLPAANEDGSFNPPDFADYEMAEIILKACDPNPENRWTDPAEMGHALVDYMQRNGAHDTPIVPPAVDIPEAAVIPTEAEEAQTAEQVQEISDLEEVVETEELTEEVSDEASEPEVENVEAPESEPAPVVEEVDETLPGMDEEDLGDGLVSDEVSDMLSQADELLAAVVPEPVVAPEPIEVNLPAESSENTAQEAPADEPDTESEETKADVNSQDSEKPTETNQDSATADQAVDADATADIAAVFEGESEEEAEKPAKPKRVGLTISIILAAIVALLAAAFAFFKFYYVETISALICEGNGTQLSVTVKTDADYELLTVICTDTYGNQHKSKVENGVAVFNELQPDSPYTITVTIDGFHMLTGKTTAAYATPKLTVISDFQAFTGNEEGSVVLRFAIDGPDASVWNVLYVNDAGEEAIAECADHMVTIQGLTVGKEYTFTLSPVDDINFDGTTEITHTVSNSIIAQDLYAGTVTDGKLPVYWFVPEKTTVSSWNVHCYNDNGYDQNKTVTNTTATFDAVKEDGEYTIEVTADGMLSGQRIVIDTTAEKIIDLAINVDSGTLTWECEAEVDEDWFVEYTIDGAAKYTITGSAQCSVELPIMIPGARYKFVVGNGETSFIGNVLVYTAAKDVLFDSFGITKDDFTFTMCRCPNLDEWNINDLDDDDLTKVFKSGEKAGFAVTINSSYSRAWQTVAVHIVIRNSQGQIIALTADEFTWRNMWAYGEGSFELPELPDKSGEYVASVYIDGALIGEETFTLSE